MEDVDVQMGLYIIVVLCLIVIAMSNYKMAYTDEYMGNLAGNASSQKFATELSGAGNETHSSYFNGNGGNEAPVFWNIGSVEDTNEALQKASQQAESNAQYEAAAAAAPKSFMRSGGSGIPHPY